MCKPSNSESILNGGVVVKSCCSFCGSCELRSFYSVAGCDISLLETLHNKQVHIFLPALWHQAPNWWFHFTEFRLHINFLWFLSIPMLFSTFVSLPQSVSCFSICLPLCCLWLDPSQFGMLISLLSIYHITDLDFLHSGSVSPEDLPGFLPRILRLTHIRSLNTTLF